MVMARSDGRGGGSVWLAGAGPCRRREVAQPSDAERCRTIVGSFHSTTTRALPLDACVLPDGPFRSGLVHFFTRRTESLANSRSGSMISVLTSDMLRERKGVHWLR